MDEKKTYLVNVESNLKKYADEAAEAKKKVDELKKANDLLKESGTASAVEIQANESALRNANKEYKQAQRMVDLQTAANKSEIGSRKQLGEILKLQEQELGKLGNAYIKDARGLDVLNPKYLEQRNRIAETKQQIIDYDLALNDGRSNVGRYRESLVQLNQILKSEEQQLKILEKTYKSDIAGRKELSTVLEAQKKKISDVKNAIGEQNKLISQESQNNIKAYGDTVKFAFASAGKSILSMVSPMALVTAGIALATKILGGLKEALLSTSKAMDQLNIYGQVIKQMFYDLATSGKISAEAIQKVAEAANLMNEKRRGDRKEMVEYALLEREIAKLEFDAADKTKTKAERQEALNKAINKQNELSDKKIADAKEDLRITEELMKLRPKDEKLREQYAKDLVNIINLDKERFEQTKRNQSRMTAFIQEDIDERKKLFDAYYKEIDETNKKHDEQDTRDKKALSDKKKYNDDLDQEAVKKSQAALQKEIDDYKDAQDKKKEAAIEFAEWDKERKLIDQENDLAILELKNTYEFELQRQALKLQYDLEVANAEKTGADITLINQKYSLAKKKIDELELKSKLSAYANFAGNIATIFGKNTAIGRAAAVAQTTIATLQSAIEAFKAMSGIPYVGPALGAVAAAAALASGYATVKEILNTKSGLPGDTGGGSAPSMPTAITSTPAAQRTYATPTGSTVLTQPQLSQEQLNTLPNQNLLTAADIAKALESMPRPVVTVEDINAKTASVRKVEVRANI